MTIDPNFLTPLATVTHLSIYGAAFSVLDSAEQLSRLLDGIVSIAELTIVERCSHAFTPQGHSIAFILSESHIALHSWPENGTAYVTLVSCRPTSAQFHDNVTALVQQICGTDTTVSLRSVSA